MTPNSLTENVTTEKAFHENIWHALTMLSNRFQPDKRTHEFTFYWHEHYVIMILICNLYVVMVFLLCFILLRVINICRCCQRISSRFICGRYQPTHIIFTPVDLLDLLLLLWDTKNTRSRHMNFYEAYKFFDDYYWLFL